MVERALRNNNSGSSNSLAEAGARDVPRAEGHSVPSPLFDLLRAVQTVRRSKTKQQTKTK